MSALRQLGRILGRAGRCWIEDDAPQLGASLAYYSLFSAAPLLIIAAAIAGAVFDEESVRRGLASQLSYQLGAEPAKALIAIVEIAGKPRQGFWAGIAGTGALLIGAVSFLASLRSALSRIWKGEAKPPPSGIAGIILTYTIATVLLLFAGLLLLAALLISSALAAVEGLGRDLPGSAAMWRLVELGVSFAVTTLVFAIVFRLASQFRWRHVWLGAIATAVLYAIGKAAFGLYVEWSGVQSGYGAAGALIVFVVWVYYTAQIILFGAELVAAAASEQARAAQFTARWRGV